MLRLLKIELMKVLNNRTFWIILGLYVLLFAPAAFGIDNMLKYSKINIGNGQEVNPIGFTGFAFFKYPQVWHNLAYLGSWFQILLAVIIVSLVSNEYSFKTLRQNIIDGMSKAEVIIGKELVIILLSAFATLVLFVLCLVLGKSVEGIAMFTGVEYVLAFFLSLVLYLNFAYCLTSLVKRAGLALGLLLLYTLVIENIAAYRLPESIAQFLPMSVIGSMLPNPFADFVGGTAAANLSPPNLIAWGIYNAVFIGIIYLLLKKGRL